MEILQQEAKLLPEDYNLYFQIAQRGKICYRREDTATKEKAQAFTLDKLEKRHTTCLEQAQAYIFVPQHLGDINNWIAHRYEALKFLVIDKPITHEGVTGFIISGNIWAFYQAFHVYPYGTSIDEAVYSALQNILPDIFTHEVQSHSYIILNRAEVIMTLPNRYENHIRRAIRFRTNRAISHQLVRHRVFSILQESQRWCRYDRGVEFIEDPDIKSSLAWWRPRKFHYACVEQAYKAFLAAGMAPQKARGVLPQDTATRLIMNGTLADWKHFFRLRFSAGADPMIRSLSRIAVNEFVNAGYGEIFEEFI